MQNSNRIYSPVRILTRAKWRLVYDAPKLKRAKNLFSWAQKVVRAKICTFKVFKIALFTWRFILVLFLYLLHIHISYCFVFWVTTVHWGEKIILMLTSHITNLHIWVNNQKTPKQCQRNGFIIPCENKLHPLNLQNPSQRMEKSWLSPKLLVKKPTDILFPSDPQTSS